MLNIRDLAIARNATDPRSSPDGPVRAGLRDRRPPRCPCSAPTRRSRSPPTSPPSWPLDAAERDAERVLPGAELDALSASGLLAITVPGRARRRRPAGARRSPRSSACSPPATPASRRSRTATSSTSTPCATRAPRPSRRSSSARCWPASASATRSPRSAPSTSATSARRSTPARQRALAAQRHQGLQHRRALRRLDPGARAPRPWPTRHGPLHVAWVERRRPRRQRRRRLGRHGPAHHGQRHGRPGGRRGDRRRGSRRTT